MAVYRKSYRPYEGRLTPESSRFLVPARFALEGMREQRLLALFYVGSLVWPLLCALFIYLHHNLSAIQLMKVNPARLVPIDARFFLTFLGFQGMLAFFLTAFTGPGLVSPDLANHALPLYLARPFSRTEYVAGKLTVLLGLLSSVTLVPGLLLFGLQAYLAEDGWAGQNLRIASGLFFGSLIWIVLLSLLALALSAWVKWKPIAGALLFGCFFVAASFGVAINQVMRTRWGNLLNISHLIGTVWVWLFEEPMRRGAGAVFFRVARGEEISIWVVWADLIAICAICLWLLARRIRGVEVVR